MITKASTVHWSGKNAPWFFSSWQSCLFPAVVKSDFSSDCPSAADLYLIRDRKRTYFSPPSPLIKRTWQVMLVLCHPGKKKHLNGGRKDYAPTIRTREQNIESGIANRIIQMGEGKTAPFTWEQSVRTWTHLPLDLGIKRKEAVGDALCYSQPNITTNNQLNGWPLSPSTHIPALWPFGEPVQGVIPEENQLGSLTHFTTRPKKH